MFILLIFHCLHSKQRGSTSPPLNQSCTIYLIINFLQIPPFSFKYPPIEITPSFPPQILSILSQILLSSLKSPPIEAIPFFLHSYPLLLRPFPSCQRFHPRHCRVSPSLRHLRLPVCKTIVAAHGQGRFFLPCAKRYHLPTELRFA